MFNFPHLQCFYFKLVTSYGGELNPDLLDLSAEQLEQLESSLSSDIIKIFGQDELDILGMINMLDLIKCVLNYLFNCIVLVFYLLNIIHF